MWNLETVLSPFDRGTERWTDAFISMHTTCCCCGVILDSLLVYACTFMCSLFMVEQKGWGVFGDSKECVKPDHHAG